MDDLEPVSLLRKLADRGPDDDPDVLQARDWLTKKALHWQKDVEFAFKCYTVLDAHVGVDATCKRCQAPLVRGLVCLDCGHDPSESVSKNILNIPQD